MAQSSARRIPSQIFFLGGKDKLTGAALTKDNNTPVVLYAPTLAAAPSVVFALSSIDQYLEDDLQRILRTVLDFRPLASLLTPAPASQQYKGSCERLLKARFPNVDWGKTYLECYNFFQQCKDHFATARAKGQNWVAFVATFLKETALFC